MHRNKLSLASASRDQTLCCITWTTHRFRGECCVALPTRQQLPPPTFRLLVGRLPVSSVFGTQTPLSMNPPASDCLCTTAVEKVYVRRDGSFTCIISYINPFLSILSSSLHCLLSSVSQQVYSGSKRWIDHPKIRITYTNNKIKPSFIIPTHQLDHSTKGRIFHIQLDEDFDHFDSSLDLTMNIIWDAPRMSSEEQLPSTLKPLDPWFLVYLVNDRLIDKEYGT